MVDARSPDLLAEEIRNFEEIAGCLAPTSSVLPRLPGIDIAGVSMPLRQTMGGDHIIYIDFDRDYDLDRRIGEARRAGRMHVAQRLHALRRRAGVLVADVSGHRTTDALIAAMLHQAFLLGVYYELDMFGEITTRLFEHINTRFYKSTRINKYFTMIYGEISAEGSFRFISAGHRAPAIFSREFGSFMPIRGDRVVSFPPVGLLPSGTDPDDRQGRPEQEVRRLDQLNRIDLLSRGDTLLLYTDGLSEHADGTFFPAGAENCLKADAKEPVETTCRRVRSAVEGAGPQSDDISCVLIRKT
ncbi:MAG: serine/threonine-protein phosphatase [bacterium]|nr:serine/threonine-protein phosphatase [bacterium]